MQLPKYRQRLPGYLNLTFGALSALLMAALMMERGAAQQAPQTGTVVVVHSYSGSNLTLGTEIARMLGARLVVYRDAPVQVANPHQLKPSLSEVNFGTITRNATRVLLGFPIWGESPSPFAFEAVSKMDLRGRAVTFFFSHIHYANPQALASLRAAAEARGAVVTEPMPFLMALGISDEGRRQYARRAILSRPDLWTASKVLAPQAQCGRKDPLTAATVCDIPAGYTWVGSDAAPGSDPGARPPVRVPVGAFEIQQSKVTITQWRQCETAGRCPRISLDVDPCRILGPVDVGSPMPCVDLIRARQYCTWAGMRVPTEAEWTRAARGDSADMYPWGNQDPRLGPLRGNFGQAPGKGMRGYEIAPADGWPEDHYASLAPVCSFKDGNSRFGLCDMAGNLYEWVESDFCGDRSRPNAMIKGGSWLDADSAALRVGSHGCYYKDNGSYLTGFRCARSR